jgi:hypothetical protein
VIENGIISSVQIAWLRLFNLYTGVLTVYRVSFIVKYAKSKSIDQQIAHVNLITCRMRHFSLIEPKRSVTFV